MFYYYVSNNHARIIEMHELEMIGHGVGVWETQGFDPRNKQSKHACAHKTNGKGYFSK